MCSFPVELAIISFFFVYITFSQHVLSLLCLWKLQYVSMWQGDGIPGRSCFSCSAPGALCPCSGLGSDVPRTVSSWVPELFQGSTGKIGFLLPGPRLQTLRLHFSLLGKIELSFIEDGFGFFCFLLGGRKGGGVVFFLPSLVTGGQLNSICNADFLDVSPLEQPHPSWLRPHPPRTLTPEITTVFPTCQLMDGLLNISAWMFHRHLKRSIVKITDFYFSPPIHSSLSLSFLSRHQHQKSRFPSEVLCLKPFGSFSLLLK